MIFIGRFDKCIKNIDNSYLFPHSNVGILCLLMQIEGLHDD